MTHGEAISLIDAAPDYRLLRRVPVVGDWRVPARQGETRRALFVDSETTGLDLERDQVIELALVPFDYERDGTYRRRAQRPGVLVSTRAKLSNSR